MQKEDMHKALPAPIFFDIPDSSCSILVAHFPEQQTVHAAMLPSSHLPEIGPCLVRLAVMALRSSNENRVNE